MKVGFVHIPKTGGGSVKHWWNQSVQPRHQMITYAHQDLAQILQTTQQTVDTSFTVVRNTWRRLISAYEFARIKIPKKLQKDPDNAWLKESIQQHNQGILAWLEWMMDQDHVNVRCQSVYSLGIPHVIVDHDPGQWQKFALMLGVLALPARTHRVMDYDPLQYLNADFKGWVATWYQDEIDRFGFRVPG